MATGIVKFFDIMKGYGFIQSAEGGKDVFVHISSLQGTGMSFLKENQEVEYSLMEERGKTKATDIRIVA
jgi:CspA family cold shock protein